MQKEFEGLLGLLNNFTNSITFLSQLERPFVQEKNHPYSHKNDEENSGETGGTSKWLGKFNMLSCIFSKGLSS